MEYLQNTVKFLSQQNLQLKQRVRRMSDLNQLITNQRQTEQRDYLHRFHQEEIAVIRQIAENNEKSLKAEIKKLNIEVAELNGSVQKGLDCIADLRREAKHLQNQKETLQEQINDLQEKILAGEERQQMSFEQFEIHYARLEEEYQCRQQEIMEKYMTKLEQSNDRHEEEMRKQTKFTDFLQNKLNNAQREKQILVEEVNRLIETLTQQEQKISTKNRSATEQVNELRKQNGNLKVYIKNLQMQMVQLQSIKRQQHQKACKWQNQCIELKAKQRELQRIKNKQMQRQKSKSKSIAKDLSNQRKYMKEQELKQRKKEADFNQSKKLLISKIRQIQHKYQNEKSKMSILQKTNTKTAKKNNQTFQSASLDTSFHRQKQSPSVSCFLNPDKPSIKKNLKIDTSSHANLLRLKDLETPCFQSAKSTQIKKTIRIRK